MKMFRIIVGGVLAALPLSLLASGCGGGSNGPTNPTATPMATPTSQPIQNVQPIQFALSDGRVVTIRLQTQGDNVFGTVETPQATTAAGRQVKAALPSVPLNWSGGSYVVIGAFTPPLSINLTGQVSQNGVNVPFVFKGTLPTATTPGIFSLTAGGRTVTVTIPAFGGPTTPIATATPKPTSTPMAQAIVFNGTVTNDALNSGITTIAAKGNSKVQHIGNSDLITGQYTFKVGNQTALLQTFGTFSRLENRAYAPGTGGPAYDIVLTTSGRRFKSYPGDGTITYKGTQNGVLSFDMDIAFTEDGKSPGNGFLSLKGSGTLTDAR